MARTDVAKIRTIIDNTNYSKRKKICRGGFVISRGSSAVSTSSGKFFIRVSDNSVPVIGSDINRISAEKGYYHWEDEPSKWSWKDADAEKLKKVVSLLHQSDRVSDFVKQKDTKEYRVSADILKNSEYKGITSLKRIENYRIKELIIEDLKIYKSASLKDIHEKIGKEITYKKVLAQMKQLVTEGIALPVGQNRWVKYQLNLSHSHFQNRE